MSKYIKSLLSVSCLIGFLSVNEPVSAKLTFKINRPSATTGAKGNPVNEIKEQGSLPELSISGLASFHMDYANPSLDYYSGENRLDDLINKSVDLKSNAKTKMDDSGLNFIAGEFGLIFSANGKFSNDTTYGANVELQAVKNDWDVDKAYVQFENKKFCKISLGNLKGPDSKFDVGGQSLIGGVFGIDGAILANLDRATGVYDPRAVVGNSNKATKIFIETRKFYGLSLGIGFTPDTKSHGHDLRDWSNGSSNNGNNAGCFYNGKGDTEKPSGTNNIAIGLHYENKISSDITLRGSAVFVTENTRKFKTTVFEATSNIDANSKGEFFVDPEYKNVDGKQVIDEEKSSKPKSVELTLNNAKSFQFSLGVTYKNLTIAGGYLNSGKSRLPQESCYKSNDGKTIIIPAFLCDKNGNAGRAWNIGAKYAWNKWKFACVYHNTRRKITKDEQTKGHIVSFTVDYEINPNFSIFGEVDYVKSTSTPYACTLFNLNAKDKSAVEKQSGLLFVAGCTVKF